MATARATRSPGLLPEDRLAKIEMAREIAASAASRWTMNKAILVAYCELGVEAARISGNTTIFDAAIAELKSAEDRIGDPDISRLVSRFERRVSNMALEQIDTSEVLVEDN